MFARLKSLLKSNDEDRCPVCGELIRGEGVERYGSASAAAGMPISIAHRLPGGGACAGQKMMAMWEAVVVVAESVCRITSGK